MSEVKKNSQSQGDEELLSKEQVFDILSFASRTVSGYYPGTVGAVTPQMLNTAMKNISFMPKELTSDELTTALKNPKDSEAVLREYMEQLEVVSMPMKRVMSYMLSHLAFDLTYTAKNSDNSELSPADYKSKAYLKSKAVLNNFLDEFDYHGQFRMAIRQILRNETFAFCPRDDGDKLVLQELPLDRIQITGRWDYGFLINFDFSYFLIPGVDIRFYPKFFRDKFNELFSDETGLYIPSLDPEKRGGYNGKFAYWIDVPPEVAWVFKFDTSLVTSIPYFSGLMPEFLDQPTIRELQKNANMASAFKMIMGQVPMRPSKTNVRDMISIDADTLGMFLALVQSAISDAVKISAAPLENMKGVEFRAETQIYKDYLKTSLASSGMDSNLFFTGDLKANAIESQLSFQSDSKVMEVLYSQFNAFMEYQIKSKVTKHTFYPKFEGNDYYLDRDRRMKNALDLANVGIVLPQKIAAANGMKPQELERMLAEASGSDFSNQLIPLLPAFNSPKGGGRPQSSDSELSDSGSSSRGDGSNIVKGGNV